MCELRGQLDGEGGVAARRVGQTLTDAQLWVMALFTEHELLARRKAERIAAAVNAEEGDDARQIAERFAAAAVNAEEGDDEGV